MSNHIWCKAERWSVPLIDYSLIKVLKKKNLFWILFFYHWSTSEYASKMETYYYRQSSGLVLETKVDSWLYKSRTKCFTLFSTNYIKNFLKNNFCNTCIKLNCFTQMVLKYCLLFPYYTYICIYDGFLMIRTIFASFIWLKSEISI